MSKRVRILQIVTILLGVVFAVNGQSISTPQVVAFGAWPLCVNKVLQGIGGECAWYVPGSETYLLLIPASSNSLTVGYSYKLTATLNDGSTVRVVNGVVKRADIDGYTYVQGVMFGGIISSVTIETSDLIQSSWNKTQQ